jgi:hypothetical protein
MLVGLNASWTYASWTYASWTVQSFSLSFEFEPLRLKRRSAMSASHIARL